ncbi:hypothetical protein [Actinomycetospora flava]|uniref:Uncharacterized protein n=1 Tax=Actinomycetospora flava TaxID=3129232 RepID=A0ABU8M7T2_9PSEU
MSADDGDEAGDEGRLGEAVDDAMKKEVWRALAPQFQHLTFESRRLQPPRDRTEIDDILDSIREQHPRPDDEDEPPQQ